jgi:hypothetical protein
MRTELLITMRCIGAASPGRLALAMDAPETDVESELIDLGIAGLTRHVSGPFPAWLLTDTGKTEAMAVAHVDLPDRTVVEGALDGFLELNPRLLQLCTDWQLRTPGANDVRLITGFQTLLTELGPILNRLVAVLPRFARYRQRFDAALRATHLADELESVHTIWFQLHEDLLVTLGINRFS